MRQSGLSLMETVISGFILAIVIIFVSALFPGSLLAIRGSESRIQAESLASRLLEEMRQVPFQQIQPLPPGQTDFRGTTLILQHRVSTSDGRRPALSETSSSPGSLGGTLQATRRGPRNLGSCTTTLNEASL